jgi:hypothetical protein
MESCPEYVKQYIENQKGHIEDSAPMTDEELAELEELSLLDD